MSDFFENLLTGIAVVLALTLGLVLNLLSVALPVGIVIFMLKWMGVL